MRKYFPGNTEQIKRENTGSDSADGEGGSRGQDLEDRGQIEGGSRDHDFEDREQIEGGEQRSRLRG